MRAGHAAVIPVLPVVDTIKRSTPTGVVLGTVDRSALRAVQTPQGFRRDVLAAAHAARGRPAHRRRRAGREARRPGAPACPASELALKITRPLDLALAEHLLADRTVRVAFAVIVPRVGIGTDVHAFDARPAVLGRRACTGPASAGLAGHSDGDVAAHAACDALLSRRRARRPRRATSAPTGRSGPAPPGSALLAETARRVRAAGFEIGNVSIQVIGVRPKIGTRRAEAEKVLSEAVGAPVTVSGTTTDGLGLTGRGEGLAAIAVALVLAALSGRARPAGARPGRSFADGK